MVIRLKAKPYKMGVSKILRCLRGTSRECEVRRRNREVSDQDTRFENIKYLMFIEYPVDPKKLNRPF